MDFRKNKILVTGADGFIGSHLVEMLVTDGYDVRALVQYNSFNSWGWLDSFPKDVLDGLEVIAGDVRDPFGVEAAMEGCSVVLHLAALIAIPYSYKSPGAYVDTNVTGTLNILQAARRMSVERVVCTSTSEVYGTADFVPMTEAHPLKSQSPYAATKTAADHLAISFHRSFNLPVTILRPFNTYGPRQSARAVIPTIITQIAGGSRRIRLGSLRPTRDFSFVTDTARGFLLAGECDAAVGEVVNIGSGFEISIGETAELIADIMGADVEIEEQQERLRPTASEVERLFACVDKARSLFGWSPQFAGSDGFRRGLERTVEWFGNPANRASYKPDMYNT